MHNSNVNKSTASKANSKFLLFFTPTAITLAAVFFAIIVTNAFRPREDTGVPTETFWAKKVRWFQCGDVVILGDSRAYEGLVPAAMSTKLPSLKILNFGFSFVGYSQSYLNAAYNVLDPKSKRKIIILGISPHTLTKGATRHNSFLEYKKKRPQELIFKIYCGKGLQYFKQFSTRELYAFFTLGKNRIWHLRNYKSDGWVAAHDFPENHENAIKTYGFTFSSGRDGPVSAEVIENVLQSVTKWHKEGIEVYGFRPPTTPEIVNIEETHSQFNDRKFRKRFEQSGGIWLLFDQKEYHTYDGHHLHFEAAENFSRDFALRISNTCPD